MAFYDRELAKLNERVGILADKAGVKFEDESDLDLSASPELAAHLNPVPLADRTPKPNTISPALPNILPGTATAVIDADKRDLMQASLDDGTQTGSPLEGENPSGGAPELLYTHAEGNQAPKNDPYGIGETYTSQSAFTTNPVDPSVTPVDGTPAEAQVMPAEPAE